MAALVLVHASDLSDRAILLLTLERLETLMAKIDELTTQVQANTTVIGSALVLINGISSRLDAAIAAANAGNDAQLTQLASDLKVTDDQLAAAVAANTPANP